MQGTGFDFGANCVITRKPFVAASVGPADAGLVESGCYPAAGLHTSLVSGDRRQDPRWLRLFKE